MVLERYQALLVKYLVLLKVNVPLRHYCLPNPDQAYLRNQTAIVLKSAFNRLCIGRIVRRKCLLPILENA
jgi:hypothetical protein